LDRDRHDLARAFLALFPGALLDLADLGHGCPLGVVDQLPEQLVSRLRRGHARDRFETSPLLLRGLLEPLAHLLQGAIPLVQLAPPFVELPGPAAQLVLGLGDTSLQARDLVAAGLHVVLGVAADLGGVLLGLLERTAEGLRGLLLRGHELPIGLDDLLLCVAFEGVRARSRDVGADQEPGSDAHDQGDDADDDGRHGSPQRLGRGPVGPPHPWRSWSASTQQPWGR
jgi:hypothetical protein